MRGPARIHNGHAGSELVSAIGYLAPVRSSVTTAKGVTSEPVPEVVECDHESLLASFGSRRSSADVMKRMARSSNLTSGASYMSHMILAAPSASASEGDNEVRLELFMILRPRLTVLRSIGFDFMEDLVLDSLLLKRLVTKSV